MTITPAMQQYYDLKAEHTDAILFFRMGDFYEMFENDAEIAHKVLGINITSRNKNADKPIALAGIPYHALDKYLPTLVKAGYKVAIAEQVSSSSLKGIVQREVTRVVTPSTLGLESDGYNLDDTNYILSIVNDENEYALSYIELSTNKWETGSVKNFDALSTQIYKIHPKEVIISKELFQNTQLKDILAKKYNLNIYYFEAPKKPKAILTDHFSIQNLRGFGIEEKKSCILASAMLLGYLSEHQKTKLNHIDSLSYTSFEGYVELDESTMRNLDLLFNFATHSSTIGTLFGVIDKTHTPMGRRLLRHNILKPLLDKDAIEKKHNIIEAFIANPLLLTAVQTEFKQVSDIDSIMTRLSLGRAYPRDLLNLKKSLQSILNIYTIIEKSADAKLIQLLEL